MFVKKSLVSRIRKTWLINPRTRVKKSKKLYRRSKAKQETKLYLKDENAEIRNTEG